ncbi:hypothetical protein [Prevotella sp. HUN102]|uniref:hypothetical protein n=1 Tax=Prevotella sp. HUN102 TaxID=1392486 RepID=UPI00048B76F1
MGIKSFIVGICMLAPLSMSAQVVFEETNQVNSVENLTVNSEYQYWLNSYQKVGNEINEVSEQYQSEVNKRGYPKKKTVKKKILLVAQYIDLLKQQRDTPALNQNIDFNKVNRKIAEWENQLNGLNILLKKI